MTGKNHFGRGIGFLLSQEVCGRILITLFSLSAAVLPIELGSIRSIWVREEIGQLVCALI